MTRVHHHSIAQSSLAALKIPRARPSSPQLLATTDLTVSTALSFPECHVVGLIPCVGFSDQLLSLSKMHVSFPGVFS